MVSWELVLDPFKRSETLFGTSREEQEQCSAHALHSFFMVELFYDRGRAVDTTTHVQTQPVTFGWIKSTNASTEIMRLPNDHAIGHCLFQPSCHHHHCNLKQQITYNTLLYFIVSTSQMMGYSMHMSYCLEFPAGIHLSPIGEGEEQIQSTGYGEKSIRKLQIPHSCSKALSLS